MVFSGLVAAIGLSVRLRVRVRVTVTVPIRVRVRVRVRVGVRVRVNLSPSLNPSQVRHGLALNTLSVPRRAGDAAGALMQLALALSLTQF